MSLTAGWTGWAGDGTGTKYKYKLDKLDKKRFLLWVGGNDTTSPSPAEKMYFRISTPLSEQPLFLLLNPPLRRAVPASWCQLISLDKIMADRHGTVG